MLFKELDMQAVLTPSSITRPPLPALAGLSCRMVSPWVMAAAYQYAYARAVALAAEAERLRFDPSWN